MAACISAQGRNLPDSPFSGTGFGADRVTARAYSAQLVAGDIRLADIPDDWRDMALSMAEYTVLKLAVDISRSANRDAWKAALYAVPEDLREPVNKQALAMFHRRRGTTG